MASDQAINSFSQMESLAYRIHANVYLAMIYHTNNQTDALKETLLNLPRSTNQN